MKTKTISPDEYNAMSRKDKRELSRNLKKEGLSTPKIPRQLINVSLKADRDIMKAAMVLMEESGMTLEGFFDLTLKQLILAKK